MKEDTGMRDFSHREKAMQRNQELFHLREQAAMLEHARNRLDQLVFQQQELREKARQLDALRVKESNDVDKLQGRSLYHLFYRVSGSLEERLEREKAEAYTAAVKYDAARQELEAVERDLCTARQEVSRLSGCEERFKHLLKEKQEEMRISGTADGERILQMEEELAAMRQQQREIQEAVTAGNTALFTAGRILDSLSSAGNWGTWDMLGGGMLTTLAKHEHMDQAQEGIERFQVELRRFQTELSDVQIPQEHLEVSSDGFLKFADLFFDGIFVDWAVQDQINRAQNQMTAIKMRLQNVLQQLKRRQENLETDMERKKAEIEEKVFQAPVS